MERLRLTVGATVTPDSVERLRAAIAGARGVVTLEGGGESFCRGLDFDWVSAALPGAQAGLFAGFAALLDAVAAVRFPTVALVDGVASGGGVALAAAADLVLATPRATFALPEIFAGLVPAVALPWVARRTGWPRARFLALTGRAFGAAEAKQLGLCDEIVDDLEAALLGYLKRWQRADPRALAAVKTIGADPDAALALQIGLLESDDTRRRLAKLVAGEPPWEE